MIDTKLRVRGGGSNYRNFVNFEWVNEVANCEGGILRGIPEIVSNEWRRGEVQVERNDEGMSFSWQSVRPYDFVHAFAQNFPRFEITGIYRHVDKEYFGVSLHKGARMTQKFHDDLYGELAVFSQAEDPENLELVREEVVKTLLNDVRAEMYLLETNRHLGREAD
jgi:hypothetical protein